MLTQSPIYRPLNETNRAELIMPFAKCLILSAAVFLIGTSHSQAASNQPDVTRYGSWGLRCQSQPKENCAITQIVTEDKAGKRPVLSIFSDIAGRPPHLAFRFTKDVNPRYGIGLKVGSYKPRTYKMFGCDKNVCEARVPMTRDLLEEIRASKMAIFAFALSNGQQMSVPVALDGFGNAWLALSDKYRAAQRKPR
jgi:invasion protein IalB